MACLPTPHPLHMTYLPCWHTADTRTAHSKQKNKTNKRQALVRACPGALSINNGSLVDPRVALFFRYFLSLQMALFSFVLESRRVFVKTFFSCVSYSSCWTMVFFSFFVCLFVPSCMWVCDWQKSMYVSLILSVCCCFFRWQNLLFLCPMVLYNSPYTTHARLVPFLA
jgi:hypothetical protein